MTEILSHSDPCRRPVFLSLGVANPLPGFRVVSSEEELLTRAGAGHVALIVVDLDRLGFDGFLRLKADSRASSVPVVLLVSDSFPLPDRLAAYAAGATDVLENSLAAQVLPAKMAIFEELFLSRHDNRARSLIANERDNFRNLFKQTPEMVCILDGPEHRFEFVNEAHIKALGFDATGKTVREAQPESVEVHGILDDVYRTGQTAELHEIPVTVGDRLRHFNLTYAARRDERGEVNGVMILGTEVSGEVRSRELLAESEARYRTLFASMNQGFCVFEVLFDEHGEPTDYRFLETNPAFGKQTGLKEVIGKTARELVPELDEFWFKTYGNVARSGESVRFEQEAPAMDRIFEVYAFKVAGTASNRVGLLFSDITERKRAQLEFERNVDVSPAMLWITEADGSCTYLSQQWYEFTGQSPKEALGFGWLEATHPDDKERTAKIYREANEAQRPFYAEYRLRTKSGEYRWAIDAGNPRLDNDGQFLGYAGAVFDVHDLKISQQRIKESQDRYMQLFNNSPLPKWIFDVETLQFLDVNETAIQHYGYSRDEFLKMRVTDIRPKEDLERFLSAMKVDYALDRPYFHDGYRHIKKDGSIVDVQISAHDLVLNGRKARMAAMIDISERVKTEAAQLELMKNLELAKQEAERANQLKSAFLANMSHEIRTPLGAMLGFADLLRDPGLSRSEHSNYLDILTRNGEQLSVIINDILDLSKVEAGHLKLDLSDMRPETIAAEVVSLLRVKSKEKNLALDYVRHESTPKSVISDPVRVRQVLLNLVANAIKFTRFGSVKIVSYGGQSANGRDMVCFEVIDTGMGISPEQQSRIFEVFVQGDDSMTRRFGGTGLGLALSRRLARALGGDVQVVKSAIDKGSTFLFQIENQIDKADLLATQKEQRIADIQIDGQSLKGLRILVVDDSPDNQQLIWHYLTRYGAAVDAADNGMLGFRKALARDYDIVLMDIQMPEMDGYTATQKLRSAGYAKPILALTAHGMTEVRKKCLNVGCTDHLTKPINSQELVSSIVRHTRH